MASRKCGYCKKESVMTISNFAVETSWRLDESVGLVTASYLCNYCALLNVASVSYQNRYENGPYSQADAVDRFIHAHDSDVRWEPTAVTYTDFDDVPQQIASVAREATVCYSLSAYRASIMLARAVIEASAKAQGISKGSLQQKIDELANAGLLSSVVVVAAHAIRDSGNAVAHGDFADYAIEVEDDEASEVIELMRLFLRDLFQSPAQAQRISEAAERRKTRRTP